MKVIVMLSSQVIFKNEVWTFDIKSSAHVHRNDYGPILIYIYIDRNR